MSDVFISYRRDDGGSAGRLSDSLGGTHEIDVFFDTESIDYGDEFPVVLKEELQACRILLAIIGPGWVAPGNLSRLGAANDWVRQELETAFARGIRVVPVLLDKATLPASEMLQPSLLRLLDLDQFALGHDTFKSDVKELAARLRQWLTGTGRRERALPTHLPFLCNRTMQEDNLIEKFSTEPAFRTAPFVIVHGHKWEEHDGFLERLRVLRSLEDLLGLGTDVGVQVIALQWSAQSAAGGKVAKSLVNAIKRNVLGKLMATEEDVRQYFQTLRQPLVLTLQVTSDDTNALGVALFQQLAAAWQSLMMAEGAPARPFPAALWINLGYEEGATSIALDGALGPAHSFAAVLDELRPVSRADAETWSKLPQVEAHVRERFAAVSGLFDEAQRCVPGTNTMRMRRFVESVRAILSQSA